MDTLTVVALWLAVPLTFVCYLNAFLAGFVILLLWLYLINEHHFHPHLVELARPALTVRDKLPSRDEFLDKRLRPLYALIDDDCIICRDEPTGPVRTPCGHIFCKDCFMDWINHDNQRCPYCTQELFHSSSRAFEMTVKLTIASIAVGVPAAIINLISGYGGRPWVMHTTLATALQLAFAVSFIKYRRRYETL